MSATLLVVGGAGFIGERLAEVATADGWDVVIADRDGSDAATRATSATRSVSFDVTDADHTTACVAGIAPDAVVHLAAYGVGRDGLAAGAEQAPARAVQVNVGGLVNVVSAAAAAGCPNIVWSSSSTVFGPAAAAHPALEVDEQSATTPTTVYGASKLAAEELMKVVAPTLRVSACGLRLPLVYGPGRWYGGSQQSLVAFVDDLVMRRPAHIDAWTGQADWIHVDDAARALLLAIRAPQPSGLYNIVGHRCSLADLALALAAAAGDEGENAVVREIDGGPGVPLMDGRAAVADLGFRPEFATATAGAADYLARVRHAHLEESP
jgi:nucleoside-diphosphate-sugar epimerase